ncbi:unnamed protein product [Urochloa decumbens]|uniref:F-box domain-containing protein n=1 Tax=Urochloa decumbens TaxID=240449 RepID=A0ABC8VDM3_9POAL
MPPPPRARATPELPDELMEEVLLRIRPDDPVGLLRAALACKQWHSFIADPDFRRRRLSLSLHGAAPPMLGVIVSVWDDGDRRPFARYVPTSSYVPPRADHRDWMLSDARHGRVLLRRCIEWEYWDFTVWNPITDQMLELPKPSDSLGRNGSMKASVLCAAIGVRVSKDMFTCIYSSESDAWSKPAYDSYPYYNLGWEDDGLGWERSVLVGNALYLVLRRYDNILECDLGTRKISIIKLPYVRTETTSAGFVRIELTTMEDGQLGFARVEGSHELCLWLRNGDNGVAGWSLCKVIDLKKLFPLVNSICLMNCLVGFADGISVAFLEVDRELFTVDIKSGLKKKIVEGCSISYAAPYFNFCTSALVVSSRDDGPRVGT